MLRQPLVVLAASTILGSAASTLQAVSLLIVIRFADPPLWLAFDHRLRRGRPPGLRPARSRAPRSAWMRIGDQPCDRNFAAIVRRVQRGSENGVAPGPSPGLSARRSWARTSDRKAPRTLVVMVFASSSLPVACLSWNAALGQRFGRLDSGALIAQRQAGGAGGPLAPRGRPSSVRPKSRRSNRSRCGASVSI